MENFPLDDAAIQYLRELDEQLRQTQQNVNMLANGMLTYFMRTHNLDPTKGWRIAENRRELVVETGPQFPVNGIPAETIS